MSVLSIVGGSQTYSSASGGKVYSYTSITTAPTPVAPPNPARQKITFHNPGAVDIFVGPAVISNINTGVQSAFAPTIVNYGGCFRVFANGGTLVIDGECAVGWQAFSVSGSGNQFTVMDSNVG